MKKTRVRGKSNFCQVDYGLLGLLAPSFVIRRISVNKRKKPLVPPNPRTLPV